MVRRRVCAIIVVVVVSCLVLFAPASVAGCVAPEIGLGTGPPTAAPGQQVTVSGRYFHTGCEDTIAYGCAGRQPPSDPEAPQRGVELVLRQGDRTWQLGTADAAGRDTNYAIRWRGTDPRGRGRRCRDT